MSHTPHELAEEFPESVEKIHALKLSDAHFARLVDDYHEVNRLVHRAESQVEPTSDDNETAMRQQRSRLKDQIWQMLQTA